MQVCRCRVRTYVCTYVRDGFNESISLRGAHQGLVSHAYSRQVWVPYHIVIHCTVCGTRIAQACVLWMLALAYVSTHV